MRKRSAYARRLDHVGGNFNGAEWLNTIQKCRTYTDEVLPGGLALAATNTASMQAMARVRKAFEMLRNQQTIPSDTHDHDVLAHAMGVSVIRAIEIAGEDPDTNPMLEIIGEANDALRRMVARRRTWGKWEIDKPGQVAVLNGIELYETIMQSSSPAQMEHAAGIRLKALRGKTQTLERLAA